MERLADITELLLKLKNQTYTNHEILLVVEHSEELLRKLTDFIAKKNMSNTRIIFTKKILGLSGARNLGIKEAKGEFVAIIDDDAVPTVEWLEQAVYCLTLSPLVIGVTGPAIPLWKDKPLEWLPDELQWIIGATTWWDKESLCEVRHAWGMNLAFKREAFEKCNGFSELHGLKKGETEGIDRFPHEDVEFSLRVRNFTKKRILYNPNMKVFHKVSSRKMNIKFFAQHAYVQGFAKRMLKELNGKYRDLSNSENSLDREFTVLKRVFTRVLPSSIMEFPKKPILTIHKLVVVMVVLFFLAIGYFSPFYLVVRHHSKN